MADQSGSGDKSEKASQQKLRKTRDKGQVARSRDLATAVGILVSLKLIVLAMPAWLDEFRSLFALGFASLEGEGTLDNLWSTGFTTTMLLFAKMLLPLAVIPFAILCASLLPGGWVLSFEHWLPKFERLNPVTNLGRLVSGKHYFELGNSMLKAAALCAVLWIVCREGVDAFLHLQSLSLDRAILVGSGLVLDGVMALCAVFVLFALIDVPAQVFFFLRNLRMTKQEVKEEHKTNEGRPEVKQRIRQLQRQLAQRGVRKAVPGADVVIVNPTHYAVALKYDEKRAEAPFVVAKGVDEMALYIRTIATEHAVETLELPPLARAIYNTSQVNQQIPMPLYRAVAQVLTYVLQLKAFRRGQRRAEPALPDDLAIPQHLSEVTPS
ncbi:flagellar type III secretion system protein FlhB [Methyloversatilis thermotolerans]|uniref:flagellar type III secretion system protein FlhB n=1 Tax=Methyloversatilis thermotolerans TaxID=1346290 RepID=UPI0003680F1E|nr:flagellar type III secretion system protein FlhB [Methyloversatilis thermotolerans]